MLENKFSLRRGGWGLIWPARSSQDERGASLIEVLVSIGLLAVAVVLLGSGATLWQSGLWWPAQRLERVISVSEDLSRWPFSPIPICRDEDLLTWWEELIHGQTEQWSAPEMWSGEQGWLPISGSECSAFPTGEVSVIKLRLGSVDTGLAEIGLEEVVVRVSRS
jgi:Flp pilus assembly pilin Flp